MKKTVFILLAILMLPGCSTYHKFSKATYLNDVRRYSEHGFYITPLDLNKEYTPISNISIVMTPGVLQDQPKKTKKSFTKNLKIDDMYYSDGKSETKVSGEYLSVTYDKMLDELVSQAKSMGANAIINFKYYIDYGTKNYFREVHTISGFAVKIDE